MLSDLVIASLIAAIAAIIVSIVNGLYVRPKLDKIHILVDGRMSEALKEISVLKNNIAVLTGKPEDVASATKAEVNSEEEKVSQAEASDKT